MNILERFRRGARMIRNRVQSRFCQVRYSYAGKGKDAVMTRTTGGFKMALPPGDKEIGAKIYCNGQYDAAMCTTLQKHLSPGDVAFDVGANIGQMTLIMADAVGEEGSVIAFEPDDYNRDFLETNLDQNDFQSVDVRREAVSCEEGTTTLLRHPRNLGAHTIINSGSPETGGAETVEIRVTTLDSIDNEPDLLKIDTEGAEPNVLAGGVDTIQEARPVLILEVDPNFWTEPVEEVMQELADIGYEFFDINCKTRLTPADIGDGNRRNVLAKIEAE